LAEDEIAEKYLFKIVDQNYWDAVRETLDQEHIFDYYTKINSRIERIQQVVLNGLHNVIHRSPSKFSQMGDFYLPFRAKVCILENILNGDEAKKRNVMIN
jgi:hypothetical protein